MRNEATFKRKFKESVKAHRGFALSLSAPMISGIPDLYIIMPGYLPVLLEAKWLGEVSRDEFNRKPKFTELQKLWLTECHDRVAYSAMGLIGLKYRGVYYASLVSVSDKLISDFNESFLAYATVPYEALEGQPKNFNISLLFQKVPIPRIKLPLTYNRNEPIPVL